MAEHIAVIPATNEMYACIDAIDIVADMMLITKFKMPVL